MPSTPGSNPCNPLNPFLSMDSGLFVCVQVRSIIGQMRPDRQTLLFSATMPNKVERLVRDALTSPVRITVGEVGAANEDIKQVCLPLVSSGPLPPSPFSSFLVCKWEVLCQGGLAHGWVPSWESVLVFDQYKLQWMGTRVQCDWHIHKLENTSLQWRGTSVQFN